MSFVAMTDNRTDNSILPMRTKDKGRNDDVRWQVQTQKVVSRKRQFPIYTKKGRAEGIWFRCDRDIKDAKNEQS